MTDKLAELFGEEEAKKAKASAPSPSRCTRPRSASGGSSGGSTGGGNSGSSETSIKAASKGDFWEKFQSSVDQILKIKR